MKISTLKVIDGYIGRILIAFFSPLAFLVNLNSAKTPEGLTTSKITKITYLKILGGGSLLIAYPAILAIRRQYPNAKIILICSPEVAAFAKLTDLIDELVLIDTSHIRLFIASVFKAIKAGWRSDIFVNYELHSKLTTLFCFFTFSRNRFGLFQNWNLWQKGYINHPIFYNPSSPIYVGYEQIAANAGGVIPPWDDACKYFQNQLETEVSSFESGSYFVLAPFCSALYRERECSSEEWAILLRRKIQGTAKILVLSGNSDAKRCSKLCEDLSKSLLGIEVVNLAGKTSLNEAASLLIKATRLIAIDSGLIHLARLLNVPTLSYWGPSDPFLRLKDVDPLIDEIQYERISCSPCVHNIDIPPCSGNNVCMQQYSKEIPLRYERLGWMLSE